MLQKTQDNAGFPQKPLSIEQLCEWAGVCRRFVEKEIACGKLKVRRLSPRLIRIMPADIEAWMNGDGARKEDQVEAAATSDEKNTGRGAKSAR
jgi:hypothetical protein